MQGIQADVPPLVKDSRDPVIKTLYRDGKPA